MHLVFPVLLPVTVVILAATSLNYLLGCLHVFPGFVSLPLLCAVACQWKVDFSPLLLWHEILPPALESFQDMETGISYDQNMVIFDSPSFNICFLGAVLLTPWPLSLSFPQCGTVLRLLYWYLKGAVIRESQLML